MRTGTFTPHRHNRKMACRDKASSAFVDLGNGSYFSANGGAEIDRFEYPRHSMTTTSRGRTLHTSGVSGDMHAIRSTWSSQLMTRLSIVWSQQLTQRRRFGQLVTFDSHWAGYFWPPGSIPTRRSHEYLISW